jgi:hypothetical protein
MDRRSRQRIWKLERLLSKTERLLPAVLTKLEKSREPLEAMFGRLREGIRLHTTAVAAIVISGEPKIDEPLVRAWERTLAHHRIDAAEGSTLDAEDPRLNDDVEDSALHELRAAEKMYPAIVDDPDYGRPHYSRPDGYWWDPGIVHAPESATFTEIFRTAPVWLLQFTRIQLDAPVLEFDLPDISAELLWGVEGIKDAERWPRLPLGTMAAGDPVCIAPEEFGSDLSPEERRFYQEMKKRPEEEWSRLERRRMRALIERLCPNNNNS